MRHALVVVVLLAASSAGAQEAQEAPATRAARAHYRAGLAYFREGDLRRAIEEFLASRQDDARPELDYNLGLAYDRLGDAAKAIDAYRLFLAARPTTEERPKIEARMADLEGKVGDLTVFCAMPGSAVTIDGEAISKLGTPLRFTAGNHVVEARKEGLATAVATVSIVGGQRASVTVTPFVPKVPLTRGAKIGIGVGTAAAALAVVGVALGVYFGTRAPAPFDPRGGSGAVTVTPIGGQ